jgi:hypothetical protein
MQDNRIPHPEYASLLTDAYARCVTAGTALDLWRSSGNPAAIAEASHARTHAAAQLVAAWKELTAELSPA